MLTLDSFRDESRLRTRSRNLQPPADTCSSQTPGDKTSLFGGFDKLAGSTNKWRVRVAQTHRSARADSSSAAAACA